MNLIDAAIARLKSFDLEVTSDLDVITELEKFGDIILSGLNIMKGQFIVRTRCDTTFINHSYENQITYIKEKESIPEYNRASLKGQAMFYGCLPIDAENNEHYCQVLSLAEASKIMHTDSESDQEEYATMGKWRVVEDFTAVSIANHKDFTESNPRLKNMRDFYLEFIRKFPAKESDYVKISEYLSNEFAKKVENERRYEYKISGAFAKIVEDRKGQGIIYPSALSEGRGFNIAIPPSIVDRHLHLEKVAVWRVQKRKKNLAATPYLYCGTFQGDGRFIWEDTGVSMPALFVEKTLSKI